MGKDKCREIAKIVRSDEMDLSEDELTLWLPDNVFGNTFRVSFVCGNCFEVYASDNSADTWSIPFYFVDSAFQNEKQHVIEF